MPHSRKSKEAQMEKDVAVFEKNKYQDVKIRISEYQGNDVIDVRRHPSAFGANVIIPG